MEQLQNIVVLTVDLKADVTTLRPLSEQVLFQEFSNLRRSNEEDLDQLFRRTCRRVAVGYALLQNVLQRSGMRNFKPAMRRFPDYQVLSQSIKDRIETDIKSIRCIYENWNLIVRNCTLPIMCNLDIRSFPLWKLAKCRCLSFVENENNKVNRIRRRPTQRAYDLTMVEDIVDNVEGATNRLLNIVNGDEEQIKKIAEDFHSTFLRRAQGQI